MRLIIRFPLRHPLYPDWPVTPARIAKGKGVAISGTVRDLLKAARDGVRAERAVFVMLPPDNPVLEEADRDRLWDAYQVPVYACLLDGDGRLAGYECEVQDGLHLPMACASDSNRLMISSEESILGYRVRADRAMIENAPCECGRPGQRLRFNDGRGAARRFEVVRTL